MTLNEALEGDSVECIIIIQGGEPMRRKSLSFYLDNLKQLFKNNNRTAKNVSSKEIENGRIKITFSSEGEKKLLAKDLSELAKLVFSNKDLYVSSTIQKRK